MSLFFLEMSYVSDVMSITDYGNIVYRNSREKVLQKLESLYNHVMRFTGVDKMGRVKITRLAISKRQITCPGVLLKDKEELYLSVTVLGQYKKTQCVPAAFPLFFQEKLVFEKAFADIVDPGDLVELLELGKILATYEENTRDFLFPDPKLTSGHHGLDREILMKRSSSFTGDLNRVHHSTPNGKLQTKLPKKITLSPEKSRHSLATKNYEQPTIASKSRSPSPYTKRRMCELSEEARQRLAHLSLGPYEFRRETDKPPFVVRRVEQPSPGIKLHTWCPTRESTVEAWTKVDYDPSLLGSYRPKKAKMDKEKNYAYGPGFIIILSVEATLIVEIRI
ncbi:spermatogenesis-associated protein hypothetical protein [Limosa lapponica baueri]|uniref:Spermatogenesis-associated protein 6 N-terminal domain-containing protein n=1 Tax=Limosa lapponica baueri TaxID=1758121 RepID=A0A2I0UJS3_LIMLA|nr:spermatogenesis-associated protein hypothetical protein [Limosa lapponica baueri]